MEEAPSGVVMALRAAGATPPPPAAAPSAAAGAAAAGRRQRFPVELKAGETTIVSWKKLMKDGSRAAGAPAAAPTGAHPGLQARIAPPGATADELMDEEPKDVQPPANRFSAVIEKIERLYMGKESSDEEELDDVPDDDQYDTEDSFIDDTELNDYFQVDKSTTKHHGFFVNRGKLEHIKEPSPSPSVAPKKRRRRDSVTTGEKDIGRVLTEFVDVSNMKMKNAARHAPLVGKNLSSPSNAPTLHGERNQDGKHQKTKLSMVTESLKQKIDPTLQTAETVSTIKMPNRELALPSDTKDHKEQKVVAAQSRETYKVKVEEGLDTVQDVVREKFPSSTGENNQVPSNKVRTREKNGTIVLPDLNVPGNMYQMQSTTETVRAKEPRPKGSMLERAIHDLERVVAEFRPAKQEMQVVADSPQGVKKRLPVEIKQKLAKVARLANSQGKIASEDFLNRLMSILGHLVQQKTLKRHLKEMVELGLSAKQAKADRFQQIKKEVVEMVKTRITSSKSRVVEQSGSSDDFQDTPGERALKAKMSMDEPIEDKICDLYDLYVEGMDEDKGPQMRKLYVELAELWPAGYVDSSGIKEAVNRAKARKRALYKRDKNQDEKLKRKRLSSTARLDDGARLSNQPRSGQDRLSDAALPLNGSSDHYPSKDKAVSRNNSSISTDAASKAIVAMKKAKRSPEGGSTVSRPHIPKLPSHTSIDKDRSLKQTTDPTESYLLKSVHSSSALSGSEQPSR